MNTNAEQILTEPSSSFVPVLVHGENAEVAATERKASPLETLQIALAFIVGSAMTLVALLI